MSTSSLQTEADYTRALAEIEPYFDALPEPKTPEAHRFEVLANLIAQYEDRHYPVTALHAEELPET